MKKNFIVLGLILALAAPLSVHAAASVKLIDFIVSSSGLTEILSKNGVKGVDAKQIESYVASSISAFGGGKNLSRAEFSEILSKLPVTGQDATLRKELQLLLDTPEKDIKKEDLVKVVNNIIYLANRHGKSVIITCADCVSDSLTKSGFKFTVENIKSSSSVKILTDIIPNNPKDLQHFIAGKVKRLGYGDYSKVTPQMISPEEEKSLALFLALAEGGSAEYKELGLTIKNLSTKNGKTNLFDVSNPNKLWKAAASDLSNADIAKMSETLKEVDKVAKKENIRIEEAFNKVIRKKSESSEELMTKYKAIKSKRCFFK